MTEKDKNVNFIILVQDLFRNVIPHQCIGSVWSRRDKNRDRDAATVVATIEQFNAVRLIHLFISLFSLCCHAMYVHHIHNLSTMYWMFPLQKLDSGDEINRNRLLLCLRLLIICSP